MEIVIKIGFAFIAGILSFLSPCIFPLIPSYLSFLCGSSLEDLKEKKVKRKNIFLNTVFFVTGFSIIFICMGILFAAGFHFFDSISLGSITGIINIIAGLIVIILGINFIFDFWGFLNIEKRFHLKKKPAGNIGSLLMGMAFGAGWTPCVGPILSSILFMAGTTRGIYQGIFLLLVYSLGLGLPFLLTGLFFQKAYKQFERIKPYIKIIKILSGVFLIFIGFLILLGRLQNINIFFFSLAETLRTWEQANPMAARLIFGFMFLILGLNFLSSYEKHIRKDKAATDSNIKLIRPLRLFIIVFCFTFYILSIAGIVNIPNFITYWFSFQGL